LTLTSAIVARQGPMRGIAVNLRADRLAGVVGL